MNTKDNYKINQLSEYFKKNPDRILSELNSSFHVFMHYANWKLLISKSEHKGLEDKHLQTIIFGEAGGSFPNLLKGLLKKSSHNFLIIG
jgi:hypothetical protein